MQSPEAAALAATQRAFAAAVLGGPTAAAPLLEQLSGPPEKALRRLAAYHRNIVGNRIAALASCYPRVAAAVGATRFECLARDFALVQDSRSGDLNEYGAEFADWLENRAECRHLPWLPDLARLEWDIQTVWGEADSEPFDFAALARVPSALHGELRFRIAPAFRCRCSRWPLAELWRQAESAAAAGDYRIWVVRPLDRVGLEMASPAEAEFIAALETGATLAAAIDLASNTNPAFDVGSTLVRAATIGILAGAILPGEQT